MENKKEIGNPVEYVYKQGVNVEIEGYFLSDLIAIFNRLVEDEVRPESKFKYNYVNEAGKIVKSPKQADIDTGKVRKVLDFERTIMNPTLDYSISEKGIGYAQIKNFLETKHFENIKKGIAVNYKELAGNPVSIEPNEEKKD